MRAANRFGGSARGGGDGLLRHELEGFRFCLRVFPQSTFTGTLPFPSLCSRCLVNRRPHPPFGRTVPPIVVGVHCREEQRSIQVNEGEPKHRRGKGPLDVPALLGPPGTTRCARS